MYLGKVSLVRNHESKQVSTSCIFVLSSFEFLEQSDMLISTQLKILLQVKLKLKLECEIVMVRIWNISERLN